MKCAHCGTGLDRRTAVSILREDDFSTDFLFYLCAPCAEELEEVYGG